MICSIFASNKSITNNSANSKNSTNTSSSTGIQIYSDTSSELCGRNYALGINSVEEASTRLYNVCADSSSILNRLDVSLEDSDSKDTLLMQYKLLIDYESLNGPSAAITSYMAYITNMLASVYNISNPEIVLNGYAFNVSLFRFNKDNPLLLDMQHTQLSCNKIAPAPSVNVMTAKYFSIPSFNMSSADAQGVAVASLSQPVPQCCLYDKCQSCDKKPSKHPLILLHGHSFNQDTLAYQSIEIFNGFEEAFSNDKLYFQTGLLIKTENTTPDILGHYDLPLMSRPTYYLETYNDLLGLKVSEAKQGNIDTYALRLKESIDYTLYITGSDKVDVVAHSMGGLVLRRYMQIFGTQNIGTVILVAAPNQGVSDRTYNLCKVFGAVNECEDMRMDGIFIKKLNDLSSQSTVKDMYLVVGKGCDTDGLDGDGVVSINNSLMQGFPQSHVFYVQGKCDGTHLLHNDLLNPSMYPEVYNFIKAKLG